MGRRTKKRFFLFFLILLATFFEIALAIKVVWNTTWTAHLFASIEYEVAVYMIGIIGWIFLLGYYWIERFDNLKRFVIVLIFTLIVALSAFDLRVGVLSSHQIGLALNAILWVAFSVKSLFELIFNSRGDWRK